MIPSIRHFGKGNTIEMIKRSVVDRGLESERKAEKVKHSKFFLGSETPVPYMTL